MSGLLKGVKKIFKKVGKVLKKIALPALAIGAVVLTGGAALGVLPSIGALGSSLGLSAGLTGVLSSAASAATMGAVTSAVTGGNIIKGATTGLVVGGALGAAGGLGQKVASAGTTASGGGGSMTGFMSPAEKFVSGAGGGGAGTVAAAAPAAVAANGGGGLGSGILSFLNNNPVVGGSLVQGIGSGMIASGQAKAQRKAEEREAANYSDTSQLFRYSGDPRNTNEEDPEGGETVKSAIPYADASFVYDKSTGKVRLVKGA